MVVLVSVIAKKVASVSPDAAKQSSPLLEDLRNLVVLMEKHLASDLQTVDLQAALIEEPPVLGLHMAENRSSATLKPAGPVDKLYVRSLYNKFDINNNGNLDEKEREALKKYIQKRRS